MFFMKARFFVNTFWRKRLHSLKTRHLALSEGAVPTQQQWNRPQIYLEVQISATHKYDTWAICAGQRRNLSSENRVWGRFTGNTVQYSTCLHYVNAEFVLLLQNSTFSFSKFNFEISKLKTWKVSPRSFENWNVVRCLGSLLSTRDKMGIR